MQTNEEGEISFFAKAGDLISGKEKETISREVQIADLSWYLRATSSDGKIVISVGVRLPLPCTTIYANIHLNMLNKNSSRSFHRLDSEAFEVVIDSFSPPTIIRSRFPVRNVKVTASIKVESVVSPEQFTLDDGLSDVVFNVGCNQGNSDDVISTDQPMALHLHRVILAKASPVFKSMLFGSFNESHPGNQVDLPDKSPELFLDFLSTIYPPFTQIHSSRARYLLPIYQEYQMLDMVGKCEDSLCAFYDLIQIELENKTISDADIEEVFDHLILSQLYSMKTLRERAIRLLSTIPSAMWEQNSVFSTLNESIRCLIYSGRTHALESQIALIEASAKNEEDMPIFCKFPS